MKWMVGGSVCRISPNKVTIGREEREDGWLAYGSVQLYGRISEVIKWGFRVTPLSYLFNWMTNEAK